MASHCDNSEIFLKCLSLYPVAKRVVVQMTSMETLRAFHLVVKETHQGCDQGGDIRELIRIICVQGSVLISYKIMLSLY